MNLLAQAAAAPWYERLLDKYGLAAFIVIFVMLGILKYSPRVIEAVINFINNMSHNYACLSTNVKENTTVMQVMGETIAQKMDPLGMKYEKHVFSNVGTNQAILSFSRAMRAGAETLPPSQRDSVIKHLNDIERLLGGS